MNASNENHLRETLRNLTNQIMECLLESVEARDSDRHLEGMILSRYYPTYSLWNLPFDSQSIGRIRRGLQKEDRESGENKIQPTAACTRRKKKLQKATEHFYAANGQGMMFKPSYENQGS